MININNEFISDITLDDFVNGNFAESEINDIKNKVSFRVGLKQTKEQSQSKTPKRREFYCVSIQNKKRNTIELNTLNKVLLVFLVLNIIMLFMYLFIVTFK